jgi:predicted DNA-binding transcriptional regulator AlpA
MILCQSTESAQPTRNGMAAAPRLLSINDACRYAGVSRSEFYKTWLPRLKSAHFGKRHMIDRASLDQLIDQTFAAG